MMNYRVPLYAMDVKCIWNVNMKKDYFIKRFTFNTEWPIWKQNHQLTRKYRSFNARCAYIYRFRFDQIWRFTRMKNDWLNLSFHFTIIASFFLSAWLSLNSNWMWFIAKFQFISLFAVRFVECNKIFMLLYNVRPFGKWCTMDFWTLAYAFAQKFIIIIIFYICVCECARLQSIACKLGQNK